MNDRNENVLSIAIFFAPLLCSVGEAPAVVTNGNARCINAAVALAAVCASCPVKNRFVIMHGNALRFLACKPLTIVLARPQSVLLHSFVVAERHLHALAVLAGIPGSTKIVALVQRYVLQLLCWRLILNALVFVASRRTELRVQLVNIVGSGCKKAGVSFHATFRRVTGLNLHIVWEYMFQLSSSRRTVAV